MRSRSVKKQVWLNHDEAKMLKNKAKKVGVNESELIRNLIKGFEPREKPSKDFYEVMKQMRAIGNNLNQIARKANTLNFIDELQYQKEAIKWNQFILDIKEEFLLPKKSKNIL